METMLSENERVGPTVETNQEILDSFKRTLDQIDGLPEVLKKEIFTTAAIKTDGGYDNSGFCHLVDPPPPTS